jgi:predicted nucleotidyltransferase component of viral defense system
VIPKDFITEWREHAPWISDAQVEQDLVISRALVEIFRDPELSGRLAFRGGTALFKLHLAPAARYSEDIDLVQIAKEPIGSTLDAIRSALDAWLGTPKRIIKSGSASLVYRFRSEDVPPRTLRLKIEINSREQFTELGHEKRRFEVTSRWWSEGGEITTYPLDELLGTKLRALYQRKKGRDLFDLWYALEHGAADSRRVVTCFDRYMRESGARVPRAEFEKNLAAKLADPGFLADLSPLLRPGVAWDVATAAREVLDKLVSRLAK